jgi:hypothetical protein
MDRTAAGSTPRFTVPIARMRVVGVGGFAGCARLAPRKDRLASVVAMATARINFMLSLLETSFVARSG